ncbi:MAG TPA: response regulator [Vicinamibacterales bacterium]
MITPASGGSPSRARVLVVDDEAAVRMLIARWVRDLGHEVVEAPNAEAALAAFAADPAAVLLCDIALPGHDGHWLVSEIQRRDEAVAVIMVTGQREVGAAVSSLEHGFIDFLVKPFSRERLREAIDRGLLWRTTGARPAPVRRGSSG